jgi:hypothetical protein
MKPNWPINPTARIDKRALDLKGITARRSIT